MALIISSWEERGGKGGEGKKRRRRSSMNLSVVPRQKGSSFSCREKVGT